MNRGFSTRILTAVLLAIAGGVLSAIDAQNSDHVTARGWAGLSLIIAGGCMCLAELVVSAVAQHDRRTASLGHKETDPPPADEQPGGDDPA